MAKRDCGVLRIDDSLSIPLDEIDLSAIRAQGAGGQNVNKLSTAIHLRFDVAASAALDDEQKARLIALRDRRISTEGVIVIKSQRFRSQEKNRDDALQRLAALIGAALETPAPRKATRPSRKAREDRLKEKARRSRLKELRRRVDD